MAQNPHPVSLLLPDVIFRCFPSRTLVEKLADYNERHYTAGSLSIERAMWSAKTNSTIRKFRDITPNQVPLLVQTQPEQVQYFIFERMSTMDFLARRDPDFFVELVLSQPFGDMLAQLLLDFWEKNIERVRASGIAFDEYIHQVFLL